MTEATSIPTLNACFETVKRFSRDPVLLTAVEKNIRDFPKI